MTERLGPGATIGILGGGQLGRMLAVAAARLGFRCHIYDPDDTPPAGQVTNAVTRAAYDDEAALAAFADAVDVVTYEFENIPTGALDLIGTRRPVRPGRQSLAISRDRLTEKQFLSGLGLRTAPFADISGADDLSRAMAGIGGPVLLKTRRFGYDGKGQVRIGSETDAIAALDTIAGAPAICEGIVDFTREVSVIGARGLDGAVVCYDPGENVHKGGILHSTTVPARLSGDQKVEAVLITGRILEALDHIGVIGVELFVTPDGMVVNEIAPRVHNSGHWTQTGCAIDQFEQHVRAITGWPLGDGRRHSDVVMENLIGEEVARAPEIAKDPSAALYLYGKAQVRAGRKMGHVNRIVG